MATERLAILLEAVGTSQVVRQLEGVSGATAGLGDKFGNASEMLRNFGVSGRQAGAMVAGAVTAAATAAAAALVTFGAHSVKTFTDMAQSVLAFQRASGATAEQASFVVAALDDVGVSAETGTKAVFQLGKRLEENSEKLSAHGISAAYDAKGNVDLARTLLNVADAYVATTDPAERAKLLTDAFGKSGQTLIPLLERGKEGIEALYASAEATGQILTQDEIDKAEEYRLALDDLHDSLQAIALAAGKALVPVLTKVADVLATVVDAGRDVGNLPYVGDLLGNIAKGAFAWADGNSAALGSLDELNAGAAAHVRELEELNKAQEETLKAILAVPTAQRALEQSYRSVGKAERERADARSDYHKMLREGAVDEEKVADAVRSHATAVRSLNGAKRDQKQAQEEYNDALAAFQQFGGDTNADKLAEAEDKLADAGDSVANAQDREKEAAEDLAKARAGDPEFNDKLAKAKQKVTDTEIALADAQYATAQRAYELDGALQEQNDLLTENAGQLGAIRSEWEGLLARRPEIEAFLKGPMATLMGAGATPATAMAPVGSDAWLRQRGGDPSTASTAPAGGTTGGGVLTGVKTVGDIVINITEAVTDPAGIARKIIWNLN